MVLQIPKHGTMFYRLEHALRLEYHDRGLDWSIGGKSRGITWNWFDRSKPPGWYIWRRLSIYSCAHPAHELAGNTALGLNNAVRLSPVVLQIPKRETMVYRLEHAPKLEYHDRGLDQSIGGRSRGITWNCAGIHCKLFFHRGGVYGKDSSTLSIYSCA